MTEKQEQGTIAMMLLKRWKEDSNLRDKIDFLNYSEWQDPKIRAEFGEDFEGYLHYLLNEDRITICTGGSVASYERGEFIENNA